MKYFSDKTKKLYETKDELEGAEKEYDLAHAAEIEAATKKKARAEEINEARKQVVTIGKACTEKMQELKKEYQSKLDEVEQEYYKARDNYEQLVRDFCKDYGAYHYTYTDENATIGDLINLFFR